MGPNPIIMLVTTVIDIFAFLVFARVVMGWLVAFEVVNLRNQIANVIFDTLYRLTEPALMKIRPYMPKLQIDISPIALLVGLMFVNYSIIWFYDALT